MSTPNRFHAKNFTTCIPAGKRRAFRRILKWFADLAIHPRLEQHLSRGQLEAQRILAAQSLIAVAVEHGDLALALDIPTRLAESSPADRKFNFTRLDAWRIAVDRLHSMRAGGAA